MKKTILMAAAVAAVSAMSANAQAIDSPSFFDNVKIGLDGGVTTPLKNNPFFDSMRGTVGLNVTKYVTPTFGVGVESLFGVNTSSWKGRAHSSTAFDNSYVGAFGVVDLFNLFGGYNCGVRPFTIEAQAGAGWGHDYNNNPKVASTNYFATKAGLNFNYNVNDHFTVSLKPSVIWNMTDNSFGTYASYNVNRASFQLLAGVGYTFGDGFQCVTPYNQAEVDALNGQINDLRGALDASVAAADAWQVKATALAADLAACQSQPQQVVVEKEVTNQYNSVRFVFFRIGSSKVTADQLPNVEQIATYMKNHPQSKVVIKGYASKDGNYDFNVKLAQSRAESVKNMLVSKYKIAANRITAEGEGIGNMFEEESWNRVSICTLESDSQQ